MFTVRITKEMKQLIKADDKTVDTNHYRPVEREVLLLRVPTLDLKKVYKAVMNLT